MVMTRVCTKVAGGLRVMVGHSRTMLRSQEGFACRALGQDEGEVSPSR